MNTCSVMSGFFTINNFKSYDQTRGNTNDNYLAMVGSAAQILNCIRFFWSGLTDHFSYKVVYGSLCLMQVFLDFLMPLSARNPWSFGICVSLIMFCEGGHFTLLPNVLKKIYGDQGTALYGIAFSYTGVCALLILFLQHYWLDSESIKSYNSLIYFCGILSAIALVILLTLFKEAKYINDKFA